MKIALIHDWLVSYGGAERCLELFHELFPDAPVFTAILDANKLPKTFQQMNIRTSFIQKLPFSKSKYRDYLPLMPLAFEQFDLRGFDVVISSSHACAKGVITGTSTCHICYCLTPMRYAWDMYNEYLEIEKIGIIKRKMIPIIINKLRIWDVISSNRIDYFVAISKHVLNRINKYYRRDGIVIYPPIDTNQFSISDNVKDYFLVISRLVPQKRVDIIIEAFNCLGLPLKIIGAGRDLEKLKKMASGNIEFLGYQTNENVSKYMSECRAIVFASYEDFGIVPLEAQSCGRPVIAFKAGGALETIIEDETGIFFDRQSPDSIISAVEKFKKKEFNPGRIRSFAKTFDAIIFKEKILKFVDEKYLNMIRR